MAAAQSLGCTLFSLAYLESPCESCVAQRGGSLTLAIASGVMYFPENDR